MLGPKYDVTKQSNEILFTFHFSTHPIKGTQFISNKPREYFLREVHFLNSFHHDNLNELDNLFLFCPFNFENVPLLNSK